MTVPEMTPKSRVWVEINLDTIERNFKHIQEAVKPLQVLAVLKANAYGLGVEKIAERLNCAGAAGFCVAELKEALPLVKFGKPVQILGAVLDYEIPPAVRNHIILGITDVETAKKISMGKNIVSHMICAFEIMKYSSGQSWPEPVRRAVQRRTITLMNGALRFFESSGLNQKEIDWRGHWIEENLFAFQLMIRRRTTCPCGIKEAGQGKTCPVHEELVALKQSRAYRLGTFLVTPLKKLKARFS